MGEHESGWVQPCLESSASAEANQDNRDYAAELDDIAGCLRMLGLMVDRAASAMRWDGSNDIPRLQGVLSDIGSQLAEVGKSVKRCSEPQMTYQKEAQA